MVQRRARKAVPNIKKRNKIARVWHSVSTALILLINRKTQNLDLLLSNCNVLLLCCVQKNKANLLGNSSMPFRVGRTALSGIEAMGDTSMDVPSTGLCLYTFQCAESICGCQRCPAKWVGEEGHCQCLCHS